MDFSMFVKTPGRILQAGITIPESHTFCVHFEHTIFKISA